MRRFCVVAVLGALTMIASVGVPSATAATEVGNRCIGNTSAENLTTISLSNEAGNPLPATIPGNGVITKWTFNVTAIPPGVLTQTLKIFRPTGVAKQFQVIGESAAAPISSGLITLSSRIPVKAGDFIGTAGSAFGKTVTVYCETTNSGDRVGAFPGNPALNTTTTITEEEKELQNPIVVFVEPDVDGDGFGDETQDLCPQSAAAQTACPVIALSTSAIAKKGLVKVLVTAGSPASVTVSGTVKLGKGKTATLKGGTQTLASAVITKFTLPFSKKLKSKLKQLSSKRSLTLKVTATAPNVVGLPTVSTLKVKLKGQAKRQAKPKK